MSSYINQLLPTVPNIPNMEDINNWTMRKVKDIADYIIPLMDPNSNNFTETGQLSVDEFISTGNQLAYSCPTWRWFGTSDYPNMSTVSYLPKEKQFLMTKNVPSLKRVSDLNEIREEDDEDGWSKINENISNIYTSCNSSSNIINITNSLGPDIDYNDFLDNNEKDLHSYQPYFSIKEDEDNIVRTWTYDISITYDKYYRTPRVYLFGYNENHEPLTFDQIMKDISSEHANKTVTFDPHPHLGINCVSIHPCLHANTMKNIYNMRGGDASVHFYLFLFLKFISTIMPTVDYDFTV